MEIKNQLWKSSTELLNWISTHRGFQSVSESRSGARDIQLPAPARYYRSWPVALVKKAGSENKMSNNLGTVENKVSNWAAYF